MRFALRAATAPVVRASAAVWAARRPSTAAVMAAIVGLGVENVGLAVIRFTTPCAYKTRAGALFGKRRVTVVRWGNWIVVIIFQSPLSIGRGWTAVVPFAQTRLQFEEGRSRVSRSGSGDEESVAADEKSVGADEKSVVRNEKSASACLPSGLDDRPSIPCRGSSVFAGRTSGPSC